MNGSSIILHFVPGLYISVIVNQGQYGSMPIVVNSQVDPQKVELNGMYNLACDGSFININCEDDEYIDILEADYGRTDETTCGKYLFPIYCVSPHALDITRERCNGKQRCFIGASVKEFGDPCSGVSKYLKVKHRCLEVPPRFSKLVTVKQHKLLKISCTGEAVIFITSVFYGAKKGNKTICHYEYAYETIKKRCSMQYQCTFMVNKNVLPDPCPQEYKQLEVSYYCGDLSPHIDDGEISGPHNRLTLCESQMSRIDCPEGSFIQINDAFYGRNDRTICPHRLVSNTRCRSPNAKVLVMNRCDGKRSCKVAATMAIFGNPCAGTHKYLDISYQCVPDLRSEIICEGGEKTLKCPPGNKLLILDALYGRKTRALCKNNYMLDIQCSADDAVKTVQKLCNNKTVCLLIAANTYYGDPCIGTFKYLKVDFSCISENAIQNTMTSHKSWYEETICEGETKRMRCPDGLEILVVKTFYGREDPYKCGGGSRINCGARELNERVTRLCNGKSNCSIWATKELLGDPCGDSNNYLLMNYYCVPGSKVDQMKQFTLCEPQKKLMFCPKGSVVTIKEAFYGRLDEKTCYTRGGTKNTNCSASAAKDLLALMCQGKDVCLVKATSDLFGDPCPKTLKYLKVDWACKEVNKPEIKEIAVCNTTMKILMCHVGFRIKIIEDAMKNPKAAASVARRCNYRNWCSLTNNKNDSFCSDENLKVYIVLYECIEAVIKEVVDSKANDKVPQEVNLSCPPGESIRILDATYGVPVEVKDEKVHTWDPNCTSTNARDILSAACDSKSSCIVLIDDKFGSLCVEKTRMLSLSYHCQTDNSQKAVACEGSELLLNCPTGNWLNIKDAHFGRTQPFVCNNKTKPEPSKGCSSPYAKAIVYETCEGKQSCNIFADEMIFGVSCDDVSKYLEVKYTCGDKEKEPDIARNITFFIKNFKKEEGEKYVVEKKEAEKSEWSVVLGNDTKLIDYAKPQIITGLVPGKRYDLRLVKMSARNCDCECQPFIRISTFNKP